MDTDNNDKLHQIQEISDKHVDKIQDKHLKEMP